MTHHVLWLKTGLICGNVEIKQYKKNNNSKNIKRNIKNYLEKNEKENNTSKLLGYSKSSSKKGVYSNKFLPLGEKKFSNKQLNFIPQETRSRTN